MKRVLQLMFAGVLATSMIACSQQRANNNAANDRANTTDATASERRPDGTTGATPETADRSDAREARQDRMENAADQQIENIHNNADQMVGKNVSITGAQINESVAQRAFSIGTQGHEVLVVGPVPAFAKDWKPGRNEYVSVSGKIAKFDKATLQKMVGKMDWDDAAFGNWQGKPVIVASKVSAFKSEDDGKMRPKSMNSESGSKQ